MLVEMGVWKAIMNRQRSRTFSRRVDSPSYDKPKSVLKTTNRIAARYSPRAMISIYEDLEHQPGPFPLGSILQSKTAETILEKICPTLPASARAVPHYWIQSKHDLTNRGNYTANSRKYSVQSFPGDLQCPHSRAWNLQARRC